MVTSNNSRNGSNHAQQNVAPAATQPSSSTKDYSSATPGCSLPREGYWEGAPFADDEAGKRIQEYRNDMATIAAQSPGLVGLGALLLKDGDAATLTLHRETNKVHQDLEKKQKDAMTARDNFPQTVVKISAAEKAATASLQAQLDQVNARQFRVQTLLTTTAADVDANFAFDSEKPDEALKVLPALKSKENASKKENQRREKDNERRQNQETAPEYDNPKFVWFTDCATGIALGLFTAVELNVLTTEQIKEMEFAYAVSLILYAVLGIGMIVSLKAGFYRLWKWAAERAADKDWSATKIASLITAFIFAVDVSIVRAFRLSDPTILNPNDFGYWLSSCVFVLPCAFAASTKGWMHGIKPQTTPAPTSVTADDKPDPAQEMASPAVPVVAPVETEQPVLPEQKLSPDAFKAQVTYAKALMEEKKRLSEDTDRIAAPFQTLLKLREEELVFATEPNDFTRKSLETDRCNAVMSHEYAKAFILSVILAFERTTHIDVNNFIKVDAKSVVMKNTSQKKPGFWARLRDRWTTFRKRLQKTQDK